jgi:hypothetical protein
LQAIQSFMWNCAVFLIAFASFTTYSLSVSHTLTVETAFVSLALLNTMRSSFRLMPSCVTAFSQASISIGRIGMYLGTLLSKSRNLFLFLPIASSIKLYQDTWRNVIAILTLLSYITREDSLLTFLCRV